MNWVVMAMRDKYLYRKRPVVIEAVRNTGEWKDIIDWLNAIGWRPQIFSVPPLTWREDGGLLVRTLEGEVVCAVGDWLLRGVAGEFYPCRHDIFCATYEEVFNELAEDGVNKPVSEVQPSPDWQRKPGWDR